VLSLSSQHVNITEAILNTKTELNTKLKKIAELEAEGKGIENRVMQYHRTTLVDEKLSYPRTVCKGEGCAVKQTGPCGQDHDCAHI
jgi:hypothetical protein